MNDTFEYIAVVALIAASPGPSTLLVFSLTVERGLAAALPAIAGDLCANAVQMTIACCGVALVVQASSGWYTVLKWAGIVYLFGLAYRAWAVPVRAARAPVHVGAAAFCRGFLVSLLNPKAIVFFAGLFPQFLGPAEPLVLGWARLGCLFVLLDGTALLIYGACGAVTRSRTKTSSRWRRMPALAYALAAVLVWMRLS